MCKSMCKVTMMLMAVTVLIATTSIRVCESSTFITQILTHPAHPGKCWHKETKTALKPGNVINIPYQCIQITCTKDLRIAGTGCSPEVTVDKNCHEVTGDLRLPYPQCCPRFQCKQPDGSVIIF